MEQNYQTYKDRGMIAVYLLGDGDPLAWATQHSLNFPVVKDTGWGASSQYERDNYIPSSSLLTVGLEVVVSDGMVYPGLIESALPEDYDSGDDDDDDDDDD